MIKEPRLIPRSIFCDERGYFENIPIDYLYEFIAKRVYTCTNFERGLVRAFHYHEYEEKVFICLRGAIKFILFPGCKTSNDALGTDHKQFVITDSSDALFCPAKYANGWQSLREDTVLLVLSNQTMQDSKQDDIRFRADDPNIDYLWKTEWR